MRLLLIEEPHGRNEALTGLLRNAGHEVCGVTSAPAATIATLRLAPTGVVATFEDGARTGELRRLLGRVRDVAERRLPALLLLPVQSPWLRAPLPADLAPAATLPANGVTASALASALAELGRRGPWAGDGGSLSFDEERRLLRGPAGEAPLTRSEAAILSELLAARSSLVPSERLAEALWGDPELDRYLRASLRSHISTLRGKLAAAGVKEEPQADPGRGYRLAAAPDAIR